MDDIMTGGSELANLVQDMWAPSFYPTLVSNMAFLPVVSDDYEGDIGGLGDKVYVHNVPEFADAENLAEDGRADAEAVTIGRNTLTINKQYVKDFILTKKVQAQSISVVDQLRNLAIFAVMKTFEKDIIAAISASSSTPDHQIAYDSAGVLALADILELSTLLDDQDVPKADRHLISSNKQHNDLFNISGFVSRDFAPNANAMSSGVIETPVMGFRAAQTSLLSATTHGFHRSFMQSAMQQVPEVEIFNLGADGKRGTRWNVTALAGLAQFSNVRVVTLV